MSTGMHLGGGTLNTAKAQRRLSATATGATEQLANMFINVNYGLGMAFIDAFVENVTFNEVITCIQFQTDVIQTLVNIILAI